MASIKRLAKYWATIFRGAKEDHEIFANVAIVLGAILGLLGYTQNFAPIISAMSISVAVALALRAIFWLPFKRHEAQEKQHETQIESLRNQLADKNDKNAKEKGDAERKQGQHDLLGRCAIDLQTRIYEVKRINAFQYGGDLRKAEVEKSERLLNQILSDLHTCIGPLHAVLFDTAKPPPIPQPENFDEWTMKSLEQQGHVKSLEAKLEQLRRSLEKML